MRVIPGNVIKAAQAAETKYGIRASVSLAQWALESGFGEHMPANSNNPFGIKARPGEAFVSVETREYYHGVVEQMFANFRKFASIAEAFDYHANLLANGEPYAKIKQFAAKPLTYVQKLTGIYATDPNYGALLTSIIRDQKLLQYDGAAGKPVATVAVVALAGSVVTAIAKAPPVVDVHRFDFTPFVAGGLGLLCGGLLVWLALVVVYTLTRAHKPAVAVHGVSFLSGEPLHMIRPEAQPLIDAVAALKAQAGGVPQATLDAANATISDLQSQLASAQATIAQGAQNDADTDAALKAAAGLS